MGRHSYTHADSVYGHPAIAWLTRIFVCSILDHRWGRTSASGHSCTRCGTFAPIP